MHFDMPIEQVLRRTDTRFQFGFANEAKQLVQEKAEFLLRVSAAGLLVLGRNEDALAAPVETLRELYGPKLDVKPPRVRLIKGIQVQEPIMHVRIALKTAYRSAAKALMTARGATLDEEHAKGNYCVLRYEAPLVRLLGLSAELKDRTAGNAKHWIALSHDALVTRDPGGRAA
jgi:predicted membrane GTPase involved in stress response